MLFAEEKLGQEMYKRLLNPRLAEIDDCQEQKHMDDTHNHESQCRAGISGEPIGEGKGKEYDDGNDDEAKEDCQGGSR